MGTHAMSLLKDVFVCAQRELLFENERLAGAMEM